LTSEDSRITALDFLRWLASISEFVTIDEPALTATIARAGNVAASATLVIEEDSWGRLEGWVRSFTDDRKSAMSILGDYLDATLSAGSASADQIRVGPRGFSHN